MEESKRSGYTDFIHATKQPAGKMLSKGMKTVLFSGLFLNFKIIRFLFTMG
jgi:hypothetical protein